MKKTLLFLAAVATLASCSKNEVTDTAVAPVNSDVIGFNTSTGMTRAIAGDNGLDELKAGFKVIGLNKDGDSFFAQEATGTVGSRYLYNTTSNKWGWEFETPDKKWPKQDYPLQFIAAYPVVDSTLFGSWATGGAKYTQDIVISNTVAPQDLLAANVTNVVSKPTNGTISLSFKHILSRIAFQIVSPVDYKVYIAAVNIKNVQSAGRTYDYKAGTYSAEPGTHTLLSYSHMGKGKQVLTGLGDEMTKGVPILGGFDNSKDGRTWKLMPQTSTPAWNKATFATTAATFSGSTDADWATFLGTNPTILDGAQIELVYRMEDAAGKSLVGWANGNTKPDGSTVVGDCFVKVSYVLDLSTQANKGLSDKGWLPGYGYTYQIKLGTPDATNGTVTDPNYKDENGGDTDKPLDNPATKPGEDITKDGYIDFEVGVDVWTDNETTIK